jgi:beta-glucosidase
LTDASFSFALNHYGTSYSTGKRISKEEAGGPGFVWSFARTEKVYEKDGVPIGVRGENGHPYDGE